MDKYKIIQKLGSGSFGVVWKAFNTQTNEIVAIKKLLLKYEPSVKTMINREVKSLVFNNHQNIVKLKEIINENNTIFLVFEYMQCSLYDCMSHRMKIKAPFSEPEVRHICFQILQGVACMHINGYIHRDLKPANLLVSNDVVKISDLGSARETDDKRPCTHNVTTSWYRAPEVFLHSKVYNSAVDMWAVGAIMFELFTFQPLFRGSSDAHVMHRICSVLGTPKESFWFDGLELARNMNYRFPDLHGVRFSELLPGASLEAVNLISSLLSWAPYARPTAMQALQHPFFYGCYRVPRSIRFEGSLVFEMAMLREMMKKKPSCGMAGVRVNANYDDMLPENPFEVMKRKSSAWVRLDTRHDVIGTLPENPFEFMKPKKCAQLVANVDGQLHLGF